MTLKTINLPDGARIAITEHAVPGATTTAIVLHGFFSNRQSANCLAAMDSFVAQGINAIAPDLYGRGDSDGAFEELTIAKGVETVTALVGYVRHQTPQHKIILTGGSYSGLVALHAVTQLPAIDALILRAPVSDWHAVWLDWLGAEKLAAWHANGSHPDVLPDGRSVVFGRDFYNDLQTTVYDTIAPRIMIPTLIVHGTADETVPLSQSEALAAVIPHSRLIVLEGADHQFSKPEDLVAYQDAIQQFIHPALK